MTDQDRFWFAMLLTGILIAVWSVRCGLSDILEEVKQIRTNQEGHE